MLPEDYVIIKPGDMLWSISYRIYGNPFKYIEIYKENKDQISNPDLIFHAAAMKHVTLCEENPCEAVKTNLLGTELVAKLSFKYNLDAMVLISTDKAVNPSSIMGASKRAAELLFKHGTQKFLIKKTQDM